MREVIHVVHAICDQVPTGGMMSADRDLFTIFMQWREQAAARLKEVMAALDGGDEHRALQLSEMEPRLPGFMAHLGLMSNMGLAEEKSWKSYCQKHGVPLPPALDMAAVQRLHDLYMKGITTESPFYKECLAAMQAGDEEKALTLIRSIVRLTRDTAARTQMDLMLKKKSHAQLAALRGCLERGQEDGVLAWLDEFERLGSESVLAEDPVYNAAVAARRVIMSRRSTIEAGKYLEETAAQAAQGNWPNVCAGIARIRRLHDDWRIQLDPAQTALLTKLEKQASEIQAEAELRSKFNQALASLMSFAGRLERQLQDGRHLSPAEIGKMQDGLSELQAAVDEFHLPVPQDDADRVHEIVLLLNSKLNRQEHARNRRFSTIYLPLVIMLGIVLWLSRLFANAHAQLKELEALRDGRLAGAANKVLMQIMQSSAAWMLNLSPETRAKLEALRKWAGLELKRLEEVEADMLEIDNLLADSSKEMTPEELMQKMLEIAEEMKQLSPDYLRATQLKMLGLQGRVAERFRAELAKNVQKARQMLGALEKFSAALDFEKPVQDLKVKLAAIQSGLVDITALEHPSVPALALPDDIKAAIARIRGKSELFAKEMTAFTETGNAMAAAEGLEPYKLALGACAKLRFKECREAEATLAVLPSEDEALARLLFGGDVKTWQIAKQQASGGFRFIPVEITPDEIKKLAALADDPNFRAAGPAKNLVEATQLREAVKSADGKLNTPLLDLMDRVARFPDGDVLVKAFIFQELGGMMRNRAPAWGLHFCPELVVKLNELDSILGKDRIRTGDWIKPGPRKKWQAPFERYFSAVAEGNPYFGLAEASRDYISKVAATGLVLEGHLDGSNEPQMKKRDKRPGAVWAYSAMNMELTAIKLASGTLPPADARAMRKWSPLLSIPVKISKPEIRQAEK